MSSEAQPEARFLCFTPQIYYLMLPTCVPSQDILLGLLTLMIENKQGFYEDRCSNGGNLLSKNYFTTPITMNVGLPIW